jgi:hypothetical protein
MLAIVQRRNGSLNCLRGVLSYSGNKTSSLLRHLEVASIGVIVWMKYSSGHQERGAKLLDVHVRFD